MDTALYNASIGRLLFTRRGERASNPLIAQLTHQAFPELAEVLREEAGRITRAWDVAVREAMPQMRHLTFDELKDSTPQILAAIADALASDDPELIGDLIRCAPSQGLSRFRLRFDVVEVMQEDRLLRAITVQHVEAGLRRRLEAAESVALHAAIDVMLQQSVIALVGEKNALLRAAAETELKFLSFLSHDMNNNLGSVTLTLQVLALELRSAGGFAAAEDALGLARKSIDATVRGMRQMLEHERLRQPGSPPAGVRVDLRAVAERVASQFAHEATTRGTLVAVEVPPGTAVTSDGELIGVVLQNLLGNALKYGGGGTVRVGVDDADPAGVSVWVSDEGPGIAPDQLVRIFDAFRRGDVRGQSGVGLGLAIASQAAKLLGAELTVESALGAGSTFRLTLPGTASATTSQDDASLLVAAR
ncbi:MAG: histidine kinase [Phycisphaerales bacterium]|nr:histidine kinase [Phycisphaerales bacterium]